MRGHCLVMDQGELEIVDSLNMIGHFGFCTLVEVDVIHEGTLFLYRVEALVFAKYTWLQLWYEGTVLLRTSPDRGGPEVVDRLDMIGHFGLCTLVEVDVIHEGTLFLYRVEALVFAKYTWLQLWYEGTVLLRTIPDRGAPEAADSLEMVRDFGFHSCKIECTHEGTLWL